jgi:hypothetical protein
LRGFLVSIGALLNDHLSVDSQRSGWLALAPARHLTTNPKCRRVAQVGDGPFEADVVTRVNGWRPRVSANRVVAFAGTT